LDQYSQNEKEFFELYHSGGILPTYTDKYGKWLTAISPLKDGGGNVIGIVEVDERYDDFLDVIDGVLYRKIRFFDIFSGIQI
jgi:hypothetical protein